MNLINISNQFQKNVFDVIKEDANGKKTKFVIVTDNEKDNSNCNFVTNNQFQQDDQRSDLFETFFKAFEDIRLGFQSGRNVLFLVRILRENKRTYYAHEIHMIRFI